MSKHSVEKLLFTCVLNVIQTKFMYMLVFFLLKLISQYSFIVLACIKLQSLVGMLSLPWGRSKKLLWVSNKQVMARKHCYQNMMYF